MDLILFVIFCLTSLIASLPLIKRLMKHLEFRKAVNKIPGPKRVLPIIGTNLKYIKTPREDRFGVTVEYAKKYKTLYRIWSGNIAEIRLLRADLADEIFKSSKHIEKSKTYDLIEPWLGQGLIVSKGEQWFKHRRIITPTFHLNVLENFCDVFGENANILVNKLNKLSVDGKVVNICPLITHTALDIICETAMGIKVHAQQTENEYVAAVYRFTELAMQRFFKPWLRSNFLFRKSSIFDEYHKSLDTLHQLTRKVIKERKLARQMMNKNNEKSTSDENDIGIKKRQAFLDLLLDFNENENQLTDDEIRMEVDTFLFAGHDTTTAGMCWALFLIGLHDDVQDKVYQEMTEIFGDDTTRIATVRDLNKMKYLERVLKESLRLYPPVPGISRKLNEDIEIDGYKIPKGAYVALQIYFIHRDERFFKDPERFDPDRFLPENSERRHPFAFVPFSAGPRNCIGQKFALLEEKSVISTMVRNFKIKSAQKREEIKLIQEIVLRPNDGINLYLEQRQ